MQNPGGDAGATLLRRVSGSPRVTAGVLIGRYIGAMRTLHRPIRIALLGLTLATALAACSSETKPAKPAAAAGSPAASRQPVSQQPIAAAAPPAAPTPLPRTALPELRADGNLATRHQRILAAASQGGAEIAFIGDSITEGWAGAGKEHWARVWGPRNAVNCGIGGDRTQHVIGRLDNGLLDALAAPNNSIKWVVLMIGTNNSGSDTAADIAEGNRAIIQRLRSRLPNARIILTAVFPRGQWPNPQRDLLSALNTRLRTMADGQNVVWMDIGPDFTKGTEIPAQIMPDFLHLSPGGYQIWSDSLERVITK